jgi:hypothetical protein
VLATRRIAKEEGGTDGSAEEAEEGADACFCASGFYFDRFAEPRECEGGERECGAAARLYRDGCVACSTLRADHDKVRPCSTPAVVGARG